MKRTEFIDWLENNTGFIKSYSNSDTEWKELVDYADYIWDEVIVEDNRVIFNWEDWKLGGIDYMKRECSFDEFIYLYNNWELKD